MGGSAEERARKAQESSQKGEGKREESKRNPAPEKGSPIKPQRYDDQQDQKDLMFEVLSSKVSTIAYEILQLSQQAFSSVSSPCRMDCSIHCLGGRRILSVLTFFLSASLAV